MRLSPCPFGWLQLPVSSGAVGTLGVHDLSILADGAGTSGAPSPRGRPRILSALALAQVPRLGACLRWPAPQAELVLGSAALGTVS